MAGARWVLCGGHCGVACCLHSGDVCRSISVPDADLLSVHVHRPLTTLPYAGGVAEIAVVDGLQP